jgi:dihydroflavonol-4-reductase
MPDMKVFVTGGTGFIGSHLVDLLQARGDVQISALVRDPRRLKGLAGKKGIEILEGDLFSLPPLPSPLDVVFHLAGLTKSVRPDDYYTVNQKGTASLLRSLEAQGLRPRVVHLSTIAAAGPSSPGGAVREEDPPRPVSPYGESKLLGEREALAFAGRMPVTIIRVGPVFGPGDEDFLVYFKYVRRGFLPLFGRGRKLVSLCYVLDLVRAMDACSRSDAAAGQVFNIADDTPRTWQEFGKIAGSILGTKPVPVCVPAWIAGLAASAVEASSRIAGKPAPFNRSKCRDMRQPGWVADVAKARKVLGFRTEYSLEDALRETITSYVREGRL